MTPKERRNAILTMLDSKEYCTVEYLAKKTGVSCMTIRRDLNLLEKEKLILRCHGGAGAHKYDDSVPPAFIIREFLGVEMKKKISAYAIEKLRRGSAVFIDASSTSYIMTKSIVPEMELRVITNSLRVVNELAERKITVYCTGGKYYPLEQAYYGSIAEKALEQFHFDAAFVSPRGFFAGDGAYDSTEHEARMHQLAISLSEQVYFLCPDSKIGCKYKYRVCDIGKFDEIISLCPI